MVLPEHLHSIWALPLDDADYPKRWQAIKSRFTRSLVKEGEALTKNTKGEYDLWQRRYWEHLIRDESDLQRHVDYIHYNPVKHGHVLQVKDWPYSSFHRYIQKGYLNPNWASPVNDDVRSDFGE